MCLVITYQPPQPAPSHRGVVWGEGGLGEEEREMEGVTWRRELRAAAKVRKRPLLVIGMSPGAILHGIAEPEDEVEVRELLQRIVARHWKPKQRKKSKP